MSNILELIQSVFDNELAAVASMESLDKSGISDVVNLIYKRKGRVAVSGIGKSAIVAQKMVATLNSTGTKSVFMHTADALHGDVGMLERGDTIIIISKSGGSTEVQDLIRISASSAIPSILLSCNSNSKNGQLADHHIAIDLPVEADPNDLAPTSSILLHLIVCDSIAIALQELNGFNANDFARLHPKGTLGKKLSLKASDISKNKSLPFVLSDANIKSIIYEISSKRRGACCVLEADRVVGIITDGDIRRMLEKYDDIKSLSAKDIMTRNPKCIDTETLAYDALQLMKNSNITQLIVKSNNDEFLGLVHLHDLLDEGLS